jgi:hypothetical protein
MTGSAGLAVPNWGAWQCSTALPCILLVLTPAAPHSYNTPVLPFCCCLVTRHAAPLPAGSAGVFQVECVPGDAPSATLPAGGFSANLSVTQDPLGSCSGTPSASKDVAITVTQPPSYTVNPATGASPGVSVCSEQETFSVNFTVTGVTGVDLPLTVVVTPQVCKIGGGNTVTTSEQQGPRAKAFEGL